MNQLTQALIVKAVSAVVSFLLTSGFMCTYVMLILINRCFLNAVFSMTKALNGPNYPKKHFASPDLSMLFEKLCLILFSSFSHSLFYFRLYKILPDPTPVVI